MHLARGITRFGTVVKADTYIMKPRTGCVNNIPSPTKLFLVAFLNVLGPEQKGGGIRRQDSCENSFVSDSLLPSWEPAQSTALALANRRALSIGCGVPGRGGGGGWRERDRDIRMMKNSP